MAVAQTSTIPGVRTWQGVFAIGYEGKLDDLLAAVPGLDAHMFADGAKRDKRGRVVRKGDGVVDSRTVQTKWLRERGRYQVYVRRTPEEREQFEEENRVAAREAPNRAFAEYSRQRRLEALANGTLQDEARACFTGAGISLIMAFNMTDDPDRPYCFPEATKTEAKKHFLALRKLFEEGGFEARTGALTQADPEFQRFVQRAAGFRAGT